MGTQCESWASNGECLRNPNYMKSRCPEACKICNRKNEQGSDDKGSKNSTGPNVSDETKPDQTENEQGSDDKGSKNSRGQYVSDETKPKMSKGVTIMDQRTVQDHMFRTRPN